MSLTPVARKLIETGALLAAPGAVPADFLHSVLTQTGLPYRNPGDDTRTWERRQGAVSLRIEAGALADPRTEVFREVGLPFGEKARLILIHLTSEALRTGSPAIEVEGSLTAYVRELGLRHDGPTIRMVRDQLSRLSAATVRLAVMGEGRAAQVNGSIITGLEMWAPKDARQRGLWPTTIRLSDAYFASVQNHAVPLARPALKALAHTALGLDLYAWLAQRLHRITPGRPHAVSWEALKDQFGPGYGRMVDFKRGFRGVLRSVQTVYPVARIEEADHGLILHHSPPPIPKRHVSAALIGRKV